MSLNYYVLYFDNPDNTHREPAWYAVDEYGVLITGPHATEDACKSEALSKITKEAEAYV